MKGKTLQAFMEKMQDPAASRLLAAMKEFIRQYKDLAHSVNETSEAVQTFFQNMEDAVIQHPLWVGCESEELERTCDGVEKFVMMRLHDRVFSAEAEEVAEDETLSERIELLRFLDVDHLGIAKDFQGHAPWMAAQKELCKITSYKTPRDKLVCILNCCKRINSSLSQSTAGTHGADEFFPILIFVMLQAQVTQLHCNLRYISRFRHPTKLVSEAAYYLTNAQSALAFISDVTAEQLTIEGDEFRQRLDGARQVREEETRSTLVSRRILWQPTRTLNPILSHPTQPSTFPHRPNPTPPQPNVARSISLGA